MTIAYPRWKSRRTSSLLRSARAESQPCAISGKCSNRCSTRSAGLKCEYSPSGSSLEHSASKGTETLLAIPGSGKPGCNCTPTLKYVSAPVANGTICDARQSSHDSGHTRVPTQPPQQYPTRPHRSDSGHFDFIAFISSSILFSVFCVSPGPLQKSSILSSRMGPLSMGIHSRGAGCPCQKSGMTTL